MAEINKLIVKFLNQEANHSELEKLENQLKNEEGIRIFNNYVKTQYLSTLSMTKYDVEKAKETIKTRLKKDKLTRRVNLYKKIAVAASIMLMFGMAFYMIYNNGHVKPIEPEKQPHLIVTGTDKAILTLENGDEVALEKGKKYQTGKVSSNGEELVYTDKGQSDIAEKGQLYNYLTIPRGGQFFVKLSDGTEVWLNSETKLKYPVKFIEGISRNVELLYGEAYFKVSPSTAHKGAAFHVLAKSQEIDVLGTEFNVKAYNDDTIMATTLVEGKIKIKKGAVSETLVPNQQATINYENDNIDIEEIDVSQEISWINGLFSFNEKPLSEIMLVLSRWYDTEVVFTNSQKKKFVFTGILERTETVDDILKLIEATSEGQIKFEINDKTIIIK
ncbi:FecR family protein [Arenibacter sp. ARW7G5Y1]|uniref:FecR family protein n=1 Tax=Arenibacter sp. ARW7G5Y1 TaxID=2135619 RepID=UPI000D775465|nr:FecR domain-containing protein [Arenibacter sp. ARW7G5Y1]PXX24013.1 FecR family protein [Arenibacter sp. ARW7G5Y1]